MKTSTPGPDIGIYLGDALARYGFLDGHPFASERYRTFIRAFDAAGLGDRIRTLAPVRATEQEVLRFHTTGYLERVRAHDANPIGLLDDGDTPDFPGMLDASLHVVGSSLDACRRVLSGELTRGFVPIGGLHHARRDAAAGFCVFNDIGILIETLREVHGVARITYVDIDAHHGDGVYYAFADDPELHIVDFHEDGRYLYPGTGTATETGLGTARGTKLNVPLPPGADDELFLDLWSKVLGFLDASRPEILLLQCGADCLAGDPLTHLRLSTAVHAQVTADLCAIANNHCRGRLLITGGGGYNPVNTAAAWVTVADALCSAD